MTKQFIEEQQKIAKINFRQLWGSITKETQHLTTEKIEDLFDTLISQTILATEEEIRKRVEMRLNARLADINVSKQEIKTLTDLLSTLTPKE